jgi:hypothetical protein
MPLPLTLPPLLSPPPPPLLLLPLLLLLLLLLSPPPPPLLLSPLLLLLPPPLLPLMLLLSPFPGHLGEAGQGVLVRAARGRRFRLHEFNQQRTDDADPGARPKIRTSTSNGRAQTRPVGAQGRPGGASQGALA